MKNLVQALMTEQPTEWLSHLERDFKIHIVRDGALASLKYNQIESPMHDPIVQQCRGMVIDVETRTVLAWPYNKFWNHGELLGASIDWSTARVQEKLDGSLMLLYWHATKQPPWRRFLARLRWYRNKGQWRVASSGHPTAGGSFGSDARTFAQAFWGLIETNGIQLQAADPRITYMLELCDAPNRVVVRHDRPRLVLHGARWLETGIELTREELLNQANNLRCEVVREFPLSSIEECLRAAEALDPVQQEGFVVVDTSFNRVKIKSPRYVILHHLKGEATPRRAIELWQTGEASELLSHFPEMSSMILPVHEKLDELARRAADEHDEALCRSIDRKSYASMATRYPFSAVMFRLLTDKVTGAEAAKSIMRRMSLAALERMLDLTTKPS